MAVSKPAKVMRVTVPRQHSHRLGVKLEAQIHKLAKLQRLRIDTGQTSSLTASIDSASEWNSLLMTARAERGPQWDIGTQQFQVDKGSALYFDPTELHKLVRPEAPPEDQSRRSNVPPNLQGIPGSSAPRGSPMTTTTRAKALEREPSMSHSHPHPMAVGGPSMNPQMPNAMHTPRRHTPGPPMNYPYGSPVQRNGPPPFSQAPPHMTPTGPMSPGGGYGGPPGPPGAYFDGGGMRVGMPSSPMGHHHPGVPPPGMQPPQHQHQHQQQHGMPMAGMPRPVMGQPQHVPPGMGAPPPMGMGMPMNAMGMPGGGGAMGMPGGDMGMGAMMGAGAHPGMMPGSPGFPMR